MQWYCAPKGASRGAFSLRPVPSPLLLAGDASALGAKAALHEEAKNTQVAETSARKLLGSVGEGLAQLTGGGHLTCRKPTNEAGNTGCVVPLTASWQHLIRLAIS